MLTPLAIALFGLAALLVVVQVIAPEPEPYSPLSWLTPLTFAALFIAVLVIAINDRIPGYVNDKYDEAIPLEKISELIDADEDIKIKSVWHNENITEIAYRETGKKARQRSVGYAYCEGLYPRQEDFLKKTSWGTKKAFKREWAKAPAEANCYVTSKISGVDGVPSTVLAKAVEATINDASNATTLAAPAVTKFGDTATTWIVDGAAMECTGKLPTVEEFEAFLDDELPALWSDNHMKAAVEKFDLNSRIKLKCSEAEPTRRKSFSVN